MFRHILVPTDGSAHSARAARIAIGIARASRGRITALHVASPFRPVYPVDFVPTTAAYPELYSPRDYERVARARAQRLLGRVARSAAAAKVKCEGIVVFADSEWKAILKAARAKRCDLIVMGTHGRRGLEAVLLGSVATKVLTHSGKPVLTCR